jgi:hypothetical protein
VVSTREACWLSPSCNTELLCFCFAAEQERAERRNESTVYLLRYGWMELICRFVLLRACATEEHTPLPSLADSRQRRSGASTEG